LFPQPILTSGETRIAFHERYRGDLGIAMPRDYLVAIGYRQ
jgi:hypothetical protein